MFPLEVFTVQYCFSKRIVLPFHPNDLVSCPFHTINSHVTSFFQPWGRQPARNSPGINNNKMTANPCTEMIVVRRKETSNEGWGNFFAFLKAQMVKMLGKTRTAHKITTHKGLQRTDNPALPASARRHAGRICWLQRGGSRCRKWPSDNTLIFRGALFWDWRVATHRRGQDYGRWYFYRRCTDADLWFHR